PLVTPLPFTGRADELARLERAVAAHKLALVEGEPGIGKTRLANAFLDQIRRTGGIVLVGAAHELEHALPYQPVIGALRALANYPDWPMLRASLGVEPLWLREVARLVPELAGDDEALALPAGRAEEARLWEGVARLLLALAARGPVALLIDDLHWADVSTLGLLAYLLRRAADTPLALLATTRPAEPRGPLMALVAALTREGRVERLALRRLSPAESAALAHTICPHDAEALAVWLQRNAEGNPYIIAELVGHARETGLLGVDGHLHPEAETAPVVPPTVYSLIESRLARLSEGARRVLDAAVAAGREFEFEVAARAAALSEGAALDALDELRAARLVEPLPDGRYRFDHSLTMEVAYREVGEPRHRTLHRRVAEALEALHRDRPDAVAGRIAAHFAEGGTPERAAAYALRAGRHAAAMAAWAEAVVFYEQALVGAPTAQRFEIWLALGDALYNRGEAARAAESFRAALGLAREPGQATLARLRLAGALIPQARYAEVITLVRDLVATGTPAEQAQALFRWGTALSLEGADLAEADLRLREAERLVADQPDPVALAQVRFELGSVAAQQGDLPRAVAYYREAMSVADAAADADGALMWRILTRNNLAYHLHLLGDLAAAARYVAEALRLAEERGMVALMPYLRSTAGEIALASGDLAAAEASFTEGLALAERLGVPERIAGLTANLGLVAMRRGQTALAIHRLSAALARADALGTRHLATQVRIWLAPLLPPTEARATLAEARAIAESGGRRHLLAALDRAEAAL
ncbi:MAG: AAA family ATPase, partial [Chloroflexales bacterium]